MNISIIGGADGPAAIFLAGKINIFMISAFAIMLFFYGVYFIKQMAQTRRGIQTRQLGKRKEKSIHITELIMSLATCLIVLAEMISIVFHLNFMPAPVRIGGVVLGAAGDLVFLTAVLTMKNSWRAGIPEKDRTEFVSEGIYQYSRNPAFLGFDMMYVGILLMFFNWVLLAFTIWTITMLHLQILQEEKYLPTVFGDEYLEYKKHTRRYLGRR